MIRQREGRFFLIVLLATAVSFPFVTYTLRPGVPFANLARTLDAGQVFLGSSLSFLSGAGAGFFYLRRAPASFRPIASFLCLVLGMFKGWAFGFEMPRGISSGRQALFLVLGLWGLWPYVKKYLPRAGDTATKHLIYPAAPRSLTQALRTLFWFLAVPTVLYSFWFGLFTYPLVRDFRTHLFTDSGDGFQMVWNFWWIAQSWKEGINPWFTPYLHHPWGITLVGASLHPWKGFLALPLFGWFPLVEIYNFMLGLTFVLTGVFAFCLCYALSGSYRGALLGGFVFTFYNNHFQHAQGHFHTISIEYVPVFLLLFTYLLARPSCFVAVAAALSAFLVMLCDYYCFAYIVMTSVILLCWEAAGRGGVRHLLTPAHLKAFCVFGLVSCLTSGILGGSVIHSSAKDGWHGIHNAREAPLDLLSLFVPGSHWYFGAFTRPFWERLLANSHESSVYLGWSVLGILYLGWRNRRPGEKLPAPVALWASIAGLFFLFALGPLLNVNGIEYPVAAPYDLLNPLPGFRLSGNPVRMVTMVSLAAAVLVSFAVSLLLRGTPRARRTLLALCALLIFEYWPSPLPRTAPDVPPYVKFLKAFPGKPGVLDSVSSPAASLFFQTFHEKPLAFGYVARIPKSLIAREDSIEQALKDLRFDRLCREFNLSLWVASPALNLPLPPDTMVYAAAEAKIYDLKRFCD